MLSETLDVSSKICIWSFKLNQLKAFEGGRHDLEGQLSHSSLAQHQSSLCQSKTPNHKSAPFIKVLRRDLIVFLNNTQQGKTGNICMDKSASLWDMKLIAKTRLI